MYYGNIILALNLVSAFWSGARRLDLSVFGEHHLSARTHPISITIEGGPPSSRIFDNGPPCVLKLSGSGRLRLIIIKLDWGLAWLVKKETTSRTNFTCCSRKMASVWPAASSNVLWWAIRIMTLPLSQASRIHAHQGTSPGILCTSRWQQEYHEHALFAQLWSRSQNNGNTSVSPWVS